MTDRGEKSRHVMHSPRVLLVRTRPGRGRAGHRCRSVSAILWRYKCAKIAVQHPTWLRDWPVDRAGVQGGREGGRARELRESDFLSLTGIPANQCREFSHGALYPLCPLSPATLPIAGYPLDTYTLPRATPPLSPLAARRSPSALHDVTLVIPCQQ
jgi:hypothetical protein